MLLVESNSRTIWLFFWIAGEFVFLFLEKFHLRGQFVYSFDSMLLSLTCLSICCMIQAIDFKLKLFSKIVSYRLIVLLFLLLYWEFVFWFPINSAWSFHFFFSDFIINQDSSRARFVNVLCGMLGNGWDFSLTSMSMQGRMKLVWTWNLRDQRNFSSCFSLFLRFFLENVNLLVPSNLRCSSLVWNIAKGNLLAEVVPFDCVWFTGLYILSSRVVVKFLSLFEVRFLLAQSWRKFVKLFKDTVKLHSS